jgi:hypothetical protein
MGKIAELFGRSVDAAKVDWHKIVKDSWCPYLDRLCLKNRKSNPDILIGSCSVKYGKESTGIIICPHRLLEKKKLFTDSIHLLTLHEPGNDFHVVPEISLPGGSVDYFLVSAKKGKVKDFAGIELQTLDTTGTVWPERQRFLRSAGLKVPTKDVKNTDTFGMNWKMTAKTILVQLHHKIQTFENLSKHLVLVLQTDLLEYMQENFSFSHIAEPARVGDSMHFHAYEFSQSGKEWSVELARRLSTDTGGVASSLGLQSDANVELEMLISQLEQRISTKTLLSVPR